MKKTFYSLISVLSLVILLSGCSKFNDQFDGLDAKTKITNLANYNYTLIDTDYAIISTAANKTANDSISFLNNKLKTASSADSVLIKASIARIRADSAYIKAVYIGANKFFSPKMQPKDYISLLLDRNYLYADKGSIMNATCDFVNSGDTLLLPAASKFSLTADDYALMGTGTNQPGQFNNMSSLMPVLQYLDKYLKLKCPYAVTGDVKLVRYMYYDSNRTTAMQTRLLTFDGQNWKAASSQFIYIGTKWLYDPTVKMSMVKSDYQIMVNYVLATPTLAVFAHPFFKNEEFYWGFSSRYSNVSFRLSYRNPYFSGAYVQPVTIDPELNALTTTEAKVALMWERLKGGMEKFVQLRFPNAVPQVSGIDVFYKVTTYVYYVGGVGGGNEYREYTFQCTAPATDGNPPTFLYISDKKVN